MSQLTQIALRRGPILPKKRCLKWLPKLTIRQVRLSYQIANCPRDEVLPQPMFYRQKSVKRVPKECSSVSRTQSSDAGVGDESVVVSQVAWELGRGRSNSFSSTMNTFANSDWVTWAQRDARGR